jgi:bifunctional UDP-N-acetylglucosamine pyrophosphorylase/glucosamine-1-phosphate N-acetyltransferase
VSSKDKTYSVIILAAGKGTRMCSNIPKVLHALNHRPLIDYCINLTSSLSAQAKVLVVQPEHDLLFPAFIHDEVSYATQDQQLGTAHAVRCGLEAIDDYHDVLILCGDMPLLKLETLERFVALIDKGSSAVLTSTFKNPFGYGRVVRDTKDNLLRIVEEKDAKEEKTINEVNSGVMYLAAQMVRETIHKIQTNNVQKEQYLTDIIEIAIQEGHNFLAINIADEDEVLGINSKRDLAMAESILRKRNAEALLDQGVTLIDPGRVDVRGKVTAGKDVTLDIGVILEGNVELGDNVYIGPYSLIKDTSIGAGTKILSHSVIEASVIGSHCSIGPFARIRPGAELEDAVKVGNFVEIKKTKIGKGSKANHFSYLGDTQIGEHTNIGAGAITCNYDGKSKHKTIIGNNSFVGTNASLVAPVEIGDNAFVAAGSVITENVPSDSLGIARAKQENKKDWDKKG